VERWTLMATPAFEEIRSLFRPIDVESMEPFFDLSSYDDVRTYATEIASRLEDGTMPCDEPWPQEQVELFRAWMDAGMPE
jgi:hypothetical protein